jgi:hypothetical protein
MDEELLLRAPTDNDWPVIAELADTAVEQVLGAPKQSEWVTNRRAFLGEQLHVVAERCRATLGYGALEHSPEATTGRYRLFLVTDWDDTPDVADALYRWLEEKLTERDARTAWLREYAGDRRILEFLNDRGFDVRERYEMEGLEMVTLAKRLREASPAA